jgi:hypothetical protein
MTAHDPLHVVGPDTTTTMLVETFTLISPMRGVQLGTLSQEEVTMLAMNIVAYWSDN